MNKNQIIVGVIGVVIIAGAAFWGGMAYTQSQGPQRGQGSGGTFAGRGGFRASTNGGAFGTIVAVSPNSITVELGGPGATSTNGTDTGSKIIIFDNATQIGKFVAGSPGDLSVGEGVMVAGTPNSDGSITAQMIQIRPAGQNLRGRMQTSGQ